LKAVNLGSDTDPTAAVTGDLAGFSDLTAVLKIGFNRL
jgi:ADP-ribosylglycohydrolase